MAQSHRFGSFLLNTGSTLAVLLLSTSLETVGAQELPDDLVAPWTVVEEVRFPDGYQPPTAFTGLTLNFQMLATALENAPREQLGVVNPTVRMLLPLPDAELSVVGVVRTQLMEPELVGQFPEIRTYAFESVAGPRVTGHLALLALGSGRVRIAAQTTQGLMYLEPVLVHGQTDNNVVYLSYMDGNRTDGLNDLSEPGDRDHDYDEPDIPPIPLSLPVSLSPSPAAAQVESGDQLRIYRIATSTTGEFYQARDTGNGLIDVVFSIVADLIGANATFEPEVAVRLIIAAISSQVIYDDPDTDPFNNASQCSDSGEACMANSDCPVDETCDANRSACELRGDNRNNLVAVVDAMDPSTYDLGFLFAARAGGGANGCAWFSVCLEDAGLDHKGNGAGLMGGFGTSSASGLIAHEGGHLLGARHTFSGQQGSCTQNEFTAGNSESGYAPGSGTTRMSYRGLCDDDPDDTDLGDNVDTSEDSTRYPGTSNYFHSRSSDEIVDNVFSGDGSNCGTLAMTANNPPVVDAGPDYTIPQDTPFTLVGEAMDDEPLTFNWEQYDRAETRRPIDSVGLDNGPIFRSVPPTTDNTRTFPHLLDLLAGVQRNGEILPTVDREMNFRFIARDNRMGGGGVAYDSMVVNVESQPFFITNPNSGFLQADCPLPVTWTVGGGDVADNVSVLYSIDGGMNFDETLVASTANDGDFDTRVPCETGDGKRVKVAAVGNIFFDISDDDIFVSNNPPQANTSTAGGSVDDNCEFLVEFEATVTDACAVSTADVLVEFIKAQDNFSLGVPTINKMPVSDTEVKVTGSILAFDLLNSPAKLTVSVTGEDGCGLEGNAQAEAVIVDDTPPTIEVSVDPDTLWPPNHKMVPITAEVVAMDNCPGVSFTLTDLVSDEPDNGKADGNTVNDIQDADIGTPDLVFSLRSERAGNGDGRVYTATYIATDGSGNEAEDSGAVTVPHNQ